MIIKLIKTWLRFEKAIKEVNKVCVNKRLTHKEKINLYNKNV